MMDGLWGGLGHVGSPSLTNVVQHFRHKSEKSFVLVAYGTNNTLSIIIISATVYGGLTGCQICTKSFTCIISILEISEVGIIAMLILQMRNLKLGKIK